MREESKYWANCAKECRQREREEVTERGKKEDRQEKMEKMQLIADNAHDDENADDHSVGTLSLALKIHELFHSTLQSPLRRVLVIPTLQIRNRSDGA